MGGRRIRGERATEAAGGNDALAGKHPIIPASRAESSFSAEKFSSNFAALGGQGVGSGHKPPILTTAHFGSAHFDIEPETIGGLDGFVPQGRAEDSPPLRALAGRR